MVEVNVNFLALLVAVIASQIIGGLWYSKLLFGNMWMTLVGKSEDDLKQNMTRSYIGSVIASIIMAYALAYLIGYSHAETMMEGIRTGIFAWLGFVATTSAINFLFQDKPLKLFMIDNGYHLTSLIVMGAVFGIWS